MHPASHSHQHQHKVGRQYLTTSASASDFLGKPLQRGGPTGPVLMPGDPTRHPPAFTAPSMHPPTHRASHPATNQPCSNNMNNTKNKNKNNKKTNRTSKNNNKKTMLRPILIRRNMHSTLKAGMGCRRRRHQKIISISGPHKQSTYRLCRHRRHQKIY